MTTADGDKTPPGVLKPPLHIKHVFVYMCVLYVFVCVRKREKNRERKIEREK